MNARIDYETPKQYKGEVCSEKAIVESWKDLSPAEEVCYTGIE